MRRWLTLFLMVLAGPVFAQTSPTLTMDVEETKTVPGQQLSLRITVLVPTYMPSPPIWPAYEAPNLMVRLPERAINPVSERVNGETWAGISRRYQISPMIPGTFLLPEAEVIVTWADPETNEPRKTTLRTEPVTLTGVVPEGAEGLDPFIAGTNVTLEQTITGDPATMVAGDSVVRSVTATIEGTSPMFLPALLPPVDVPGLRAYADEPVLEIRDNRGDLSGTRTERVTLVAEGGGAGQVMGLTLDWFNLDTGKIETASADGFTVQVQGPSAVPAEPVNWRAHAVVAVLGLICLALLVLLVQTLWPRLRQWQADRRMAYLASEAYAWRQLRSALHARDLSVLHTALELWAARLPGADARRDLEVTEALLQIGAAAYGTGKATPEAGWAALTQALPRARRNGQVDPQKAAALPDLNG